MSRPTWACSISYLLLISLFHERSAKQRLKKLWIDLSNRNYRSIKIHLITDRMSMLNIESLPFFKFTNTESSNWRQSFDTLLINSGAEWSHLICSIRCQEENFYMTHYRKNLSCAVCWTVFQEKNNFSAWCPSNKPINLCSSEKKIVCVIQTFRFKWYLSSNSLPYSAWNERGRSVFLIKIRRNLSEPS